MCEALKKKSDNENRAKQRVSIVTLWFCWWSNNIHKIKSFVCVFLI